jgi:hypothetical protein
VLVKNALLSTFAAVKTGFFQGFQSLGKRALGLE